MRFVCRLLSFLFAFWVVCAAASAQDIRYVHPEKYERATKTEENGLVQWAEHAEIKCQTCSGTGKMKCPTCERFYEDATFCIECKRTKEAVCRVCAGEGHFPDPLQKALCPGCQGAGFLLCGLCSGGGRIKSDTGGDRWSTCPGCRGEGGWKCGACGGARLVDSVQLKPSLAEANLATLTKAMATTDEALAGLGKWSPADQTARKAVKDLVKQMKIAEGVYPPLKKVQKALEDAMSKTAGGSQYQGQEEREGELMGGVKNSTVYFLQHQRRMLELCKKRQEANAKLAEENKGK